MSYLPKSVVEENIKKRIRKNRRGEERIGYEAYFGTDPFTKSPVRKTRNTIEDLKKDIKDFFLRHQAGGDAAVRLNPMQALDARTALDALAMAKVGMSLTDVVRAFLDGSAHATDGESAKTLGEAWDEFYKSKPDGDDKRTHRYTTGKFVQSFGGEKRLSLVTAKDVVNYLAANYGQLKPKTYNSHLLGIKTFFNWCAKDERKYIPKSPIKSVKFKEEPWEEPEYMKVQDVERLFRILESEKGEHPEYLAQAVVGFFCGTRAVEIRRMAMIEGAAKIHLDDETVRIAMGKGFQRGKMPRAFHLEKTAMAWIKSFDFMDAIKKINNKTVEKIYKLARKHNVPVFQNCIRHTFITYHVAAFGNPANTQAIVGTSKRYCAMNYCGLASKKDGEAYFAIMPTDDGQIKTAP